MTSPEVYWQYIGHGWAVDSDHVTDAHGSGCWVRRFVRATMCAHGAMVRSTEACPLAMMARFCAGLFSECGRLCRNPFGIPLRNG